MQLLSYFGPTALGRYSGNSRTGTDRVILFDH
jgi:hypothetical protein